MTPANISTQHSEKVREYFDSLSHTWQDRYAGAGSMRPRLERFRRAVAAQISGPAHILDFGCGPGDLSSYLGTFGYRVLGLDESIPMVNQARARFDLENVRFECLNARKTLTLKLPFSDAAFDACVASSVLEYVFPLGIYLNELRRVITDRGCLFATVPNPLHPIRIVERAEKAAYSRLPRLARISPEGRTNYLAASVNRFSIERWRNIFGVHGWQVEEVRGFGEPLAMLCARAC